MGAGPLALARAQRAQTARILIETSSLSMAEVALGAGFSSIRQFNETVRAVFALTPTELRRRSNGGVSAADGAGALRLRLAFRRPRSPGAAGCSTTTPTRRRTMRALLAALVSGQLSLGPSADREATLALLDRLPGIGPWTRDIIAMRALGDPDVFPVGDLGVRRGAAAVGLPGGRSALSARAERWRPWRAYAVQHLWAATAHPINEWPPVARALTGRGDQEGRRRLMAAPQRPHGRRAKRGPIAA